MQSNDKHVVLGAPASEPQAYQAGGPAKRVFKKAKEFLDQPMYHGGTYTKGDTVTQPLYMSPNQRLAESYVDEYRNPGSRLVELKPQVSNPAPERLVKAAARKIGRAHV